MTPTLLLTAALTAAEPECGVKLDRRHQRFRDEIVSEVRRLARAYLACNPKTHREWAENRLQMMRCQLLRSQGLSWTQAAIAAGRGMSVRPVCPIADASFLKSLEEAGA